MNENGSLLQKNSQILSQKKQIKEGKLNLYGNEVAWEL